MRIFNAARILGAVLAGAVAFGFPAAQAQQPYPVRPVTLVVPFAAGGATDALARLIAVAMSRDLGQQIIIENVSGGGGTVGSTRVARSTPDGYTLLLGHAGTHAASVGFYKKLPYDPVNDYEAIGEVGERDEAGVPAMAARRRESR